MTESASLQHRNILLVIDNIKTDWAGEVIKENDPAAEFHLFTIGFSPEQAFVKYKSSPPGLRQRVTVVGTAGISRMAEKDAREFYLEFIRNYPRQRCFSHPSILEALSYGGRNLWWYLGVSEKNIWNDQLVHRLYAIMRLLYTCESGNYHEARLHVDDILLQDVLKQLLAGQGIKIAASPYGGSTKKQGFLSFTFSYSLQVCRELVKTILTVSTLKASGISSRGDIPPGALCFFSTYPDWWKNPFSEDATDLFFNRIPEKLAEKEPVRHILLLMPWQCLFTKRREVLAFLKKRPVTVLERKLKAVDVLSLLSPKLFLKCLTALKISRESPATLQGVDISPLIREALFQSLTSPMFFHCLMLDRAMRRIPLENAKVLFFRLEFQPLERAILYNSRGKTTTVGFQHSALSNNFLNYVFADGELGDHWGHRESIESMPLPDYILTSGELGIQYMQRAGYPREHLAIGGALRFSNIYDYVRSMPSREALRKRYALPLDKTIILVTPSPLLQETICMFDDLFSAVKEGPSDFHIIIKFHPDALKSPNYVSQIQKVIYREGNGVTFDFLTGSVSLHDYIALSDAVLLTGGTVALESMLLGCVPLIYINESQFSHNPMTEYPDAVILVDGRTSMRRALDFIGDGTAAAKLRPFWSKPIRDMFYDTSENPGKRFLTAVREQFHISC